VAGAIRAAIVQAFEVQVYAVVLLKPGHIPKTTSGKIQRRACRAAFLAGELTVVAQDVFTTTEATIPEVHLSRESLLAVSESDRPALLTHYLQAQIAQALQLDVQQIDSQQPLSSLGLDSLRVFSLRNQIEADLNWDIPIADLFSGMTLAELVQQGLSALEQSPVERQLPPLQPLSHVLDNYPLSFSQQRLRFLDQLDPGNPAYNIALVVQLQGGLDIAALTQSLNTVVQRHESLRTTFPMQQGQPVQVIAEVLDLPLVQVDLQTYSEAERERVAQQLATAQLQQSFDLSQGPLVRATLLQLSQSEAWLVLAMHHIISDGHSMEVLYQELTSLYQAKVSGGSPLAPLPIQYKDFSHWQHQWLQGSVLEKQLTYWRQQLANATTALSLPSDRPRPAVLSFRGSNETCTISAELTQQLQDLSRRSGVTLFMTLLAAWQTLLYRYSGQTDICVGTPISSRTQEQLNSLIGFFVNTLVLRTDLSGDPSFQELLQRVRQVALEAYAHQDLPFEQLVQALQPQRHTSYTPLFQVMLTLQSELPTQETAGLTWQTRSINGESAQFDLSLDVTLTARGMDVCLKYSTDLFDAATIAAMLNHLQTLLAGVCEHSEQPLSQLPLLTETERQQALYDWNQTHKVFPEVAGIHHLFEIQAESTPDAIAVIFGDTQLTYRELNQRANQLAHRLQQLGVESDTLVGICVERSLEMVIGLLGILKAGGAYVPFDPSYPSERLSFMLQDAEVSILLTQQTLLNSLPPTTAQTFCLDTDWESIQAYPSGNSKTNNQNSSSLAYVIYTSGSTGKPKGAMNTHQGICNRLLWMQDAYGLNAGDRVLQKTPFSFDVSVWEFFWPLMTGACLVVAPPDAHKDSAELVRLITQHQITTLHFVPSMLRIFLNDPRITACTSLRRVICSGEALAADLPPLFFQRLTAELHNLYGPTEAAVDVTAWRCWPDWQEGTIPIGYPIANTQIYILNSHLQPVPVGVAGELHIGGVGVGLGYLNRPELTAEKFIPNPFREGDRLYKTGDLARYRRDGSIEYLGRLDYQVKLRGLRIELGEIEAVLAQHPAVQTSVVVVRQLADQQQLVAYVVPESAAAIPEANDISLATQLRQDLRQQLPDYMVPSVVMLLPSLPLTPNGKVDRRALPEPTVATIAPTSQAQPQTRLERLIAEVWQTVLQVPQVGLQDNFFDLGGHSLLMAQVQFQLQEQIQQEVSMVDLFQYPTVQALAQYLSSKTNLAETTQLAFQSVRDRAQKQKLALNRQRKFRNQG
ncbi:MAG TPA: amino acid adenylation domain-containing protein, partial [Candidatus Obscuribacterales bacterium]